MRKTIKYNDIFDIQLDDEEQEISDILDKQEIKSVPDLEKEIARARIAAANTLHENAQVNISLSNLDLMHLKQKAAYKGVSYQTFIASVLHEYAAGHFYEVA